MEKLLKSPPSAGKDAALEAIKNGSDLETAIKLLIAVNKAVAQERRANELKERADKMGQLRSDMAYHAASNE